VAQVMAGVPQDQRCRCNEQQAAADAKSGGDSFSSPGGGFFSSLFGKR
jgi:hypothetical protein